VLALAVLGQVPLVVGALDAGAVLGVDPRVVGVDPAAAEAGGPAAGLGADPSMHVAATGAVGPVAAQAAAAASAAGTTATTVRAPPTVALPVTVTIRRLDPREVRADSTITVVATLTNTGPTPIGALRVRLERGALISTRSELAAADSAPPPTVAHSATPMSIDAGLAPRQTVQVTYRCPATGPGGLGLVGLGVYPLALDVRGTDGTGVAGRAQTFLPYFPADVAAKPTRVAWLWPLLDRPHRLTGDGRGTAPFTDDGLAVAVRRGGRLDRLLAAAEQVTGRVRLTLVVDPETIEALGLMAKGYRVWAGGRIVAGSGQRDAADWLIRLRAIAPRHVVAAVPYADPDVVALHRDGVDDHLYRLEQSDLDALDRELALRVAPSRLAWPPGGLLTDGALDDLVDDQGIDAVVLDSAALPGGNTQQTPTPSAVSPLPALRGQAVALVTDAQLQRIVAQSVGSAGGPRLAEQRYLAELAMITAQKPDDQRTYVITPPRRWAPPAGYADAVLADTDIGAISWLTSLTVPDAVSSTESVDRGPLRYPAGAQRGELPVGLYRIGEMQRRVSDFRTALTNSDANALLSGYGDALRRAGSSAWRDDLRRGRANADRLFVSVSWLQHRVTVVQPTTGIYTLTSSDSPLSLTVRNDLPAPVTARVQINTRSAPGFHVRDIGLQQIPPGARTTLRVPATVQRAGTFTIRVHLITPKGGGLGEEITLTVRSTAYGAVALGITGVALLVLVAAVVVRMLRRLGAGIGEVPPPGTPADRSVP